MTSQYHMQRYFYAWASNPNVRQAYPPEPVLLRNDVQSLPNDRSKIVIIIPASLNTETSFLLYHEQRPIELITDTNNITLPSADSKVTLYIHGSIPKPNLTGTKLSERQILTDRQSLPVGFNVIES